MLKNAKTPHIIILFSEGVKVNLVFTYLVLSTIGINSFIK